MINELIELQTDHFFFGINDTDMSSPLIAGTFSKAILKIAQDAIERAMFEAGVDGLEFDLIERMDDVFAACNKEADAREEDRPNRRAAE